MSPSTRDALLRLCSHTYPRAIRERDGEAIVDLARELADAGSSPLREAAGLLLGGTSVRLRATVSGLAAAPWHEARARLALPLAAALFALAAVWAGRSGVAQAWVGWSVVVTFAAAALTLAGAAGGHRWLTAAGAFAVTGMLGLDALRDQYGQSRYDSEVGSALVDVLVMWIPAGILMLVCAGAVRRVAPEAGVRRLAWALIPGAVLLVIASEPTRVVVADRIVLFGGFLAAAVLVALAVTRRRADPVLPLIAALMVAVAAGPALWLIASFLPPPESGSPPLALVYFGAGGLLTAGSVLLLAGLSRRAPG
jgi:hypothetical protein